MENGNDAFEREERCIRAIKNVAKSCVMRCIVVMILMLVLLLNDLPIWVWIVLIGVVVINVLGAMPLITELKKRHQELAQIRAEE